MHKKLDTIWTTFWESPIDVKKEFNLLSRWKDLDLFLSKINYSSFEDEKEAIELLHNYMSGWPKQVILEIIDHVRSLRKQKVKTRIAPSPTGSFHLGTLRTTLLNYVHAKANNGIFLVRIDDTDITRNKQEYIDLIYYELRKFGLIFDETFQQSQRLNRYKEVAEAIGIKRDNTFILEMEGYDMVILRENGYPTYNFASILDDYDYDITHIIRGVDHIANLKEQRYIWQQICCKYSLKLFPTVIHAGLLFDGKEKLSKRKGNGITEDYNNYSVNAILNWLFKFGWSHPDPNFDSKYKTLTLDQMISLYHEGNISTSNCKIDLKKLEWLNKRHKSMECNRKHLYLEGYNYEFRELYKMLANDAVVSHFGYYYNIDVDKQQLTGIELLSRQKNFKYFSNFHDDIGEVRRMFSGSGTNSLEVTNHIIRLVKKGVIPDPYNLVKIYFNPILQNETSFISLRLFKQKKRTIYPY